MITSMALDEPNGTLWFGSPTAAVGAI
jgi:hypothetical protein